MTENKDFIDLDGQLVPVIIAVPVFIIAMIVACQLLYIYSLKRGKGWNMHNFECCLKFSSDPTNYCRMKKILR